MVFLKKDAKIGTGRQQERMHLQTPSLLSNDWGEVRFTFSKQNRIIKKDTYFYLLFS